jgi:hypothetical protein
VHPEDVRELVAAQFADLERMVEERPELRVKDAELDGTDIFLTIVVETNPAESLSPALALELAPKKIFLPGAGGMEARVYDFPQAVPLLGQKTARDLVLHIGCDGFNGRPPLAELLRPDDRTPLPDYEWPREPAGQGIVQAHPIYKRKFFCRPGLREFHDLDQHADHPWDAIREQSTIGWIVVSLLGELQTRWTMV